MAAVALSLPELRIAILQYLDMTSLVAAAQINKVWAEDATNVSDFSMSMLCGSPDNDVPIT